jgi:hypothetical protein
VLWKSAWFTAAIVAFVVGFGATYVSGGAYPGQRWPPEPGVLVAMAAFGLVLLAGVQITQMRDRRRRPKAWYREPRTIAPATRRNAQLSLFLVAMAAVGLLLRHFYG